MTIPMGDNDALFTAWRLLRLTGDMIARARHAELMRSGISIRQAAVLHLATVLGEKATPAAIARAELRRPHTVSAILQTMEKQGLVRRQRDLERRNQVRAVLTEKGRQAYQASTRRETVHRIMACLTPEEMAELERLLGKIGHAAKKELRAWGSEEIYPI